MTAQLNHSDGPHGAPVARHLVFVDAAHQYSMAATPGAPVLVAELAPEAGGGTAAMEFLRREDTAARTVTVLTGAGAELALAPPAEPLASWAATAFTAEFEEYLRATGIPEAKDPEISEAGLSALGALLVLRTHTGPEESYTEVLVCARVRSIGTLFTRVTQFAHAASAGIAELTHRALAAADSLQDYVRIENTAYLNPESGIEIEQKLNLLDEVSIWDLSKRVWGAVDRGEFPGFITDPGYELTRWHFVQHNFEVLAPAGEIGHIAFQANPDGRYQLKIKKFPADALRREESFVKGVVVEDGDFEGYLARAYPGLTVRQLPGFRRTRFDVNVQSLATGHCFGIETDEVTVPDHAGRKLKQVEMEYLETRRHAGMDATTIDADMDRLTSLVERYLADQGITTERTFYSKLSFLRDCLEGSAAEAAGA
ncbi:hypothetical protein [Streptomyces sp. NPDC047976]|uniref:hypothetical protein n=1 Tax=Streptomyces sp. NPDC047976 TaxID=3155746 RepID=UPI0034341883